jgi:hypothetical protein
LRDDRPEGLAPDRERRDGGQPDEPREGPDVVASDAPSEREDDPEPRCEGAPVALEDPRSPVRRGRDARESWAAAAHARSAPRSSPATSSPGAQGFATGLGRRIRRCPSLGFPRTPREP